MDASAGDLRIQIFGITAIDHQAGTAQAVLIDLQRARHARHPDDHVGFRQSLLQRENATTT